MPNLLLSRFGTVITEFWGVIHDLSNLLSLIQASYSGFNLGSRVGQVSGITHPFERGLVGANIFLLRVLNIGVREE